MYFLESNMVMEGCVGDTVMAFNIDSPLGGSQRDTVWYITRAVNFPNPRDMCEDGNTNEELPHIMPHTSFRPFTKALPFHDEDGGMVDSMPLLAGKLCTY